MINKSSTEYYNLEKVAEVLSVSTAEVNRLREQNKLRGFRDGSNWKFNKEDIHTYLAESIKARTGNGSKKAGDSDFDLGGNASPSSFDLLMEDAALPDDDQLVSVSPAPPSSDVDLAALDHDSDLALAEETQISSLVMPKKAKVPKELSSSVIPVSDDDSSALVLAPMEDSHEVDMEDLHEVDLDEESVLEADGSSPQLGLAGDSGFDVLVAGDDASDVLEVEEKTESFAASDFTLEPSMKTSGSDDSDSSSQVIAIDVGFAEAAHEAATFEPMDVPIDDFGAAGFGFDSGVHAPAAASSDPFGAGAAAPDVFAMPTATVSLKKTAAPKEEYSTGVLLALVSALVVMLLPGIMLLDAMLHMWSWSDPFILNSVLMSTISGWFGL